MDSEMAHHIDSSINRHAERRRLRYAGRILLVSGRVEQRQAFADSLNGKGFCVLETQSASEAYCVAREMRVSIIITDIDLPGVEDGFGLTRKLKGDRRLRQMPVAVLADRISDSVRRAAGDAGCDLISTRSSARTLFPLIDLLISR
jgi:DNA-binding response OmpR family regulator